MLLIAVVIYRAANGFVDPALDLGEVVALEQVVDIYREIHMSFMGTPASKACMQAEKRSRLTLVVW